MKYLPYTNIICFEYNDFVQEGMCSATNYDQLKFTKKIRVHGRGGNGRAAVLIEFEEAPEKYQMLWRAKYGDPKEYISKQPIAKMVYPSPGARQFFATYTFDNGQPLKPEYQHKYTRQAEWMDMILRVLEDKRALKDVLKINIDTFWKHVIDLHQVDKPICPDLPVTLEALRKKLNSYKTEGLRCLVSNKFGNQNTRKVTAKIENLILSLYCMDHKPYLNEVCRKYRDFMRGELQVVDMITGEVFSQTEFYVKDAPYVLGESTVDYYIKKPANIAAIDKQRMSQLQWRTAYRPHVHRKSPYYAFSKISMDDVDIPFKDLEGGRPVKSYQIYDVASEAVIGKAFSRDKNVELLRESLRDMYQLILSNGWGMPMEIEMERHLTKNLMGKESGGESGSGEFTADILTEANVFKYVRVCLGGNAPEKRAEHKIRAKKYTFQNKRPGFQGRFYARLVTNRLNQDDNRIRYAYEQIVQNELDDIEAYNHSLHPNQELYPDMTRWEVLEQYQNPEATVYPPQAVMPYLGYRVDTSVRAGYVEVQYNKYRLSSIGVMNELVTPNVEAYYMPGEKGIDKVYIYQEGKFISECRKVEPFQEAKAEQTAADVTNAQGQWGYQKAFDRMIREKRDRLSKVGVSDMPAADEVEEAEMVPVMAVTDAVRQAHGDTKRGSYEGGYKQESVVREAHNDRWDDAKSRAVADL